MFQFNFLKDLMHSPFLVFFPHPLFYCNNVLKLIQSPDVVMYVSIDWHYVTMQYNYAFNMLNKYNIQWPLSNKMILSVKKFMLLFKLFVKMWMYSLFVIFTRLTIFTIFTTFTIFTIVTIFTSDQIFTIFIFTIFTIFTIIHSIQY